MDNMSTQQKLDRLVKELERNGQLTQELAAEIPLVFLSIEDEDERRILAETFKRFERMWRKHPNVAMLWRYLLLLFERDSTRAGLMQAHQLGRLEQIGEL
jgi:hypothetical protein